MPPKISLDGVTQIYGGERSGNETCAVADFSLQVEEGSFVCLLGPSGCGKSTILNLIAGFERVSKGSVRVDGKEVTAPGPDRGVVFQDANLLPWRKVVENITIGQEIAGIPQEEYFAKAQKYIRLTGLNGFENYAPYELSGGMRQRVALARAWIAEPQVLLMDEPFGALDAQTRLSMQELLTGIWQQTRATVLFVTHDVDEAVFLADRVIVMSQRPGKIVEDMRIPFPRPRQYESLILEPAFGELKHELLQTVRAAHTMRGDGEGI
ncbi:ABC transporter ATP-binding protein [Betaproteobacteria bacterium]|nr:ABC transporter ATP-binding protein [Betaproteobacteria bacterium]